MEKNLNQEKNFKYAEIFSQWYGWGSPVGLSIFLLSLALAVLILAETVNVFM
ncbi:MAG: hypothetical protein JW982_16695 [Spirochaetes bacterium]|nr:hypothetical protein [Spirochaetota bacterium]